MDIRFSQQRGTEQEGFQEVYQRKVEELDVLAAGAGFPCGIPLAAFMDNEDGFLRLQPTFVRRFNEGLGSEFTKPEPARGDQKKEDMEWFLRNSWNVKRPWHGQWGTVEIWEHRPDGKIVKQFTPWVPSTRKVDMLGFTSAVLTAFGLEKAEVKAREKLESMLSPRQRRSYLLCEAFFEEGRSGMIYFLRKNRPTIAIRPDEGSKEDGKGTALCTLCLHPIGFYFPSFAGVMAPSDDVIAHLLMIRSDEHFFWRKAQQHPLDDVFAGLG